MKTKAEQTLATAFAADAGSLAGSPAVAAARQTAFAAFAAAGLPHRRVEEWKYTDLRAAMKDAMPVARGTAVKVTAGEIDTALGRLAEFDCWRVVLVDGHTRADLARLGAGRDIEVTSLAAALAQSQGAAAQALTATTAPADESVVSLNTALMSDGVVVRIAAGARLAKPLLILNVRSGGQARLTVTRNIVHVGVGAEAVILEVDLALAGGDGGGQTNTTTEIAIGDGAVVEHIKLAHDRGATHLASWMASLGAACTYRAFQLTLDQALTRNQTFATFKGEGAKLDISGLMLGRGREHIDTTLVIDHAVPGCESRELFKTVLDNSARAVFQGKAIVRPNAQKTDGKQMAQALMLSPDAEFDSKPELEIYADDVICGHGSTCTEIDADLMFYMMARGIPATDARTLLIESFVGEAIEKIQHAALRAGLMAIARDWLARPPTSAA